MQELEKIPEEIDREIEERRKDPEMRDVDICYVLNRAKEIIRKRMNDSWIPVEERLPEDDDFVLATVTGIYNALTFSSAIQLASYCKDDGWFIEGYPDWENPNVSAWSPLPEPYTPKKGAEECQNEES